MSVFLSFPPLNYPALSLSPPFPVLFSFFLLSSMFLLFIRFSALFYLLLYFASPLHSPPLTLFIFSHFLFSFRLPFVFSCLYAFLSFPFPYFPRILYLPSIYLSLLLPVTYFSLHCSSSFIPFFYSLSLIQSFPSSVVSLAFLCLSHPLP